MTTVYFNHIKERWTCAHLCYQSHFVDMSLLYFGTGVCHRHVPMTNYRVENWNRHELIPILLHVGQYRIMWFHINIIRVIEPYRCYWPGHIYSKVSLMWTTKYNNPRHCSIWCTTVFRTAKFSWSILTNCSFAAWSWQVAGFYVAPQTWAFLLQAYRNIHMWRFEVNVLWQ